MLQQMASDIQSDGIRMDVIEETYRAPKPFDTQIKDLFHAYGQCATELNIPFSYRSTGGVCDGNILAGAGLPTLDTAGAVGGSLHTFDEYLIVSSLVERAKLAALFLFKLANGDLTIHPRCAMPEEKPRRAADRLKEDPRVIQAKKLLMEAFADHQKLH